MLVLVDGFCLQKCPNSGCKLVFNSPARWPEGLSMLSESWHLSYLNLSHIKSSTIQVWGSGEAGGEEPATDGLGTLHGQRCGGIKKPLARASSCRPEGLT